MIKIVASVIIIRKTKNTFYKENEGLALTVFTYNSEDLSACLNMQSSFITKKWNNGLHLKNLEGKSYILTEKEGELIFENFENIQCGVILDISIRNITLLRSNIQEIKKYKNLICGKHDYN